MYAAILTSIETGENSWESNFDRYETILYRKMQMENKRSECTSENPQPQKKWYCREWNREGCPKNSPHQAWFGSGASAVKRTVLHACATCILKENKARNHPEGHQECPYKD